MSTKFSLNTFCGLTIKYGGGPGAHNEEEEGRRWSVKRPHGKLKFQNFLTVVVLLSLAFWPAGRAVVCACVRVHACRAKGRCVRSVIVFLLVMATKRKVVAAKEAGFVSVQLSTPEKPRGTFIHLEETVT